MVITPAFFLCARSAQDFLPCHGFKHSKLGKNLHLPVLIYGFESPQTILIQKFKSPGNFLLIKCFGVES